MGYRDSIANAFAFYNEVSHSPMFLDNEIEVINGFCNTIYELEELDRIRLRNAKERSNIPEAISKEDIGPSFRTIIFEPGNHDFLWDDLNLPIEHLSQNTAISKLSIQEVKEVKDTITFPAQENKDEIYLKHLNDDVTPILINLIKHEDFEFGESCPSIDLVESHLSQKRYVTLNWLNELYLHSYVNDVNLFVGLLRIAEYIGNDLNPLGNTMAIVATTHENYEVKELGVRILEANCTHEALGILKNIDISNPWLATYVNLVISDFEEKLK